MSKRTSKSGPLRTEFCRNYITCMLWSETDAAGRPLDERFSVYSLTEEAREQLELDCGNFLQDARRIVPDLDERCDLVKIAHDFHLTRNRHGAGFWDGDYADDIGRKLTELSHTFGEVYLYAKRNKIHIM